MKSAQIDLGIRIKISFTQPDIFYDNDIEERIFQKLRERLGIFTATRLISKRRIEQSDGFYAPDAKIFINLLSSKQIPEVMAIFVSEGFPMKYTHLKVAGFSLERISYSKYCRILPSIGHIDTENLSFDPHVLERFRINLLSAYERMFSEKINDSLLLLPRVTKQGLLFELFGTQRTIALFCVLGLIDESFSPIAYPMPLKQSSNGQ
ncbi:hypothetical protein [Fervidobacterium thailandense]|uniref:Uncharacterized protein n=1 Tax=Fervidobacterium thailandense TaxID=1008305 RepID=A0A1E3G194_9BACT|nr:hypothetical protein [Fervidobacterium thailandense]ODN29992.1 hypothetical protein A4H02_07910 [Fervidobacterium thailandense]